jgi:hypothetical protein
MRAIFIHSGWRTGSTYVWTKFRQNGDCMAFYEPFNEFLIEMTKASVYLARHDLQAIHHSEIGRPYFHEYLPLLGEHGMPLFDLDFSYRNYFRVDEDLPQQRAYLESILKVAERSRKIPVLGFVRSLGRVPWFRRQFADSINLVVLRSPLAQWLSGRELAQSNEQEFYDPMQLLILSQARGSPALVELANRFDIPRLDELPFGPAKRRMFDLVRNMGPAARFKISAWLYVLKYMASLPCADVVIDIDRLSGDSAVQGQVTADIQRLCGLELEFSDANMPRHVEAEIAGDLLGVVDELLAVLRSGNVMMPHAGLDPKQAETARLTILQKFEHDRRFLAGSLLTAL